MNLAQKEQLVNSFFHINIPNYFLGNVYDIDPSELYGENIFTTFFAFNQQKFYILLINPYLNNLWVVLVIVNNSVPKGQ
jgi:hypothetical protein